MGKPYVCKLTKEELEKAYLQEGRTLKDMCAVLGVKNTITAKKVLNRAGIDTNNNQRIALKARNGMTEEEFEAYLRERYERGDSMNTIAKSLGNISPVGVRKYFVKYGIERRGKAGYGSIDSSFAVNWKGGRNINSSGYVEIKVEGYPYTNRRGYVYEHRYVVEQHLGRFLTTDEVVHHIDGNTQNNSLDNLLLLSNSEHLMLHRLLRRGRKNLQRK